MKGPDFSFQYDLTINLQLINNENKFANAAVAVKARPLYSSTTDSCANSNFRKLFSVNYKTDICDAVN